MKLSPFIARAVALCTIVFSVSLSAQNWTFTQQIAPPLDPTSPIGGQNDEMGQSVALDANTFVVGAPKSDVNGSNSGSVFVYEFDGLAWSQIAQLAPSAGDPGDEFGSAVAVHGDRILVSAPFREIGGEAGAGAIYVFEKSAGTWAETAVLTASDGESFDQLGESIVLQDSTLVAGAAYDDDLGLNAGAAYVFDFDGTQWNETAKLVASDGVANDNFGLVVDINDTLIVVGSILDDDNGSASGSAYVYNKSGSSWSELQKLTAPDGASGDEFGKGVSVHGDRIAIGSSKDDDGGNNRGSVYLFQEGGGSFAFETKLQPAGLTNGSRFGFPVSIENDRLIAGTAGDDANGTDAGAVFVFEFSGTWAQSAKVTPIDASAGDEFGGSLALSGDHFATGAVKDDDSGEDSGSAYLFQFSGSWNQSLKVNDNDMIDDPTLDTYGNSVAVDGGNAIVGAYQDDDAGSSSGSIYFYEKAGSQWQSLGKFLASDAATQDFFGFKVAISGDYAMVGAYADDDLGSSSGSVYVFQKIGGVWSEVQKLTASDGDDFENFGFSVDIEGDRAIIGAPLDNGLGPFTFTGAAYIFERIGGIWQETAKIAPSDPAVFKQFGNDVGISGDRIIVGARNDSQLASNAGAAYIFEYDGSVWQQEQKLLSSLPGINRIFGISVDIHSDQAIVGASADPGGGGSNAGASYLFERSGGTWNQVARRVSNIVKAGENFGWSVHLDDGKAAVGAYNARNTITNDQTGAAFLLDSGVGNWNIVQRFEDEADVNDQFGFTVSLSGDVLMVGAQFNDENGNNSGSVYFYQDCQDLDNNDICDFDETTVTNDDCNNAIELIPSEYGVPAWYGQTLFGTTESLTGCIGDADDDVWFQFEAASSQDFIVAQDANGTADVVVEVYDACGGSSLGCFDDYPAGDIERSRLGNLVPGQNYFFRVYFKGEHVDPSDSLRVQVKTFVDSRLRDSDCNSTERTLDESVFSLRDDLNQLYVNPVVPVKGYGFRFQEQGGGLDVTILNPEIDGFYLQLDDVPGLQYATTYDVTVQHLVQLNSNGLVSDIWTDFGSVCTVALQNVIPTTQLQPQFCTGLDDYLLSDQLQAIPVLGAEGYRFTFNGPGGPFVQESANYAISLFELGTPMDGLQYGASYLVSVETQVNGIWSDPGPTCSVFMATQPENTQVNSAFCNGSYLFPQSNFILADQVLGAQAYEFRFTGGGNVFMEVREGVSFQFHTTAIPFVPGITYATDVRVLAGGQWSDFQNACPITIVPAPPSPPAAEDGRIFRQSTADLHLDEGMLSVYPNPNDGDEFMLESYSHGEFGDVVIELMDLTGSVLHIELHAAVGPHIIVPFKPDRPLVSGMYILQMRYADTHTRQTFVVY